jgi:hypothetical protein
MGDDGLTYAGSAFVALSAKQKERFWRVVEQTTIENSAVRMGRMPATWVAPALRVEVRYLRGEGMLRHATLTRLVSE